MKHLDDGTPSEYFEGLPKRVLSQLENTMQTDSSDNAANSDAHLAPPPSSSSSDDSGLHDIRSLARSTKQRISRKITSQPFEEDVLASSSAGWKAVALPEPAKMVSLPELADLPSKAEIKARDKAAKEAAKAAAKAAAVEAKAAPVVETKPAAKVDAPVAKPAPVAAAAVDMPVSKPAVTPIAAAKPRTAAKSNTGRNIAIAGMGLAAAAAVVVVVMNNKSNADGEKAPASTNAVKADTGTGNAAEAKPSVTPIAPPPAPAQMAAKEDVQEAPPPPPTPPVEAPTSAVKDTPKPAKGEGKKAATDHSVHLDLNSGKGDKKDEKKPAPTDVKTEAPKNADGKDPSLDDLLKDAGGNDIKKTDKPKLEKKSLSTSDITSGMGAVGGQARACFKGTQGQANVRLTVTPDGHVSKVSVSGVFAGKPEAACVEAAVRSASFPAWDGGPQSFNFSYLLSE